MNTLKSKMKTGGLSAVISFAVAVLSVITLIGYSVYGVTYQYFDTVVCLFLVCAAILGAAHVYAPSGIAQVCNLLCVMCLSGAVALFFLNSYPVWADELNGITMYGSRGGLKPVIALLVLLLVSAAAEIVSCFIPEKEG